MIKNKFIPMALATVLSVGMIAGCGNAGTDANVGTEQEVQTETVAETATENNEAKEAETGSEAASTEASSGADEKSKTSEETEEAAPVAVHGIRERSDEMRDISAMELVSEMTAGWNLGNTLDAHGSEGIGTETSWGNPKITKELIDTVCEKGFDSIRIPITWYDHVGAAPDYAIDPEWMDRVEEVVNYALDDGMFVLIDTHHEESWRILDAEHIDAVDAENIALWTQIAERFKDYGDHLVFEGLNEPRTKGSAKEWSGGTPEERDYVNRLNKSFVDTVRATGGNNEKRLLLVTTYGGANMPEVINQLEVPDDEHIGVAIHAYEPYDFTFASGQSTELFRWDGSRNGDIIKLMTRLNSKFIENGIPVLLTEYGAVNKNENNDEIAKWADAYVSRATAKGIPCFWWDNGVYDQEGEKFAILDRQNLTWYRENVVDAVIKASYTKEN